MMEVGYIAVDHFEYYNFTHSSWSAFKIAGMLVADGGLGLTSGFTEITNKHWVIFKLWRHGGFLISALAFFTFTIFKVTFI